MFDLNELFIYAKVVDCGGFAPAARELGASKSTISRRVAQLEARLGVRLIHRSTRQFQVTEIGQAYYRHCVAMMIEAQAAESIIAHNRAEPCGTIRLSCTSPLLSFGVAPLLARFAAQYPSVKLYVKTFNRRVDVISEGFDIALSLCFPPLESSELVMKVLARSPQVLVASPALLARQALPVVPEDLAALPRITWEHPRMDNSWQLKGSEGACAVVGHPSQLSSDDVATLKHAVLEGVGVANLPFGMIRGELAQGRLAQLLCEWTPVGGLVLAVFPSRRGLLPSVRTLIDFLSREFAEHWPNPATESPEPEP